MYGFNIYVNIFNFLICLYFEMNECGVDEVNIKGFEKCL